MSSVHPKSEGVAMSGNGINKANYHQLVEEWVNYPAPARASFFPPLDFTAPALAKRKIQAGYCENISSYVKVYGLDDDGNNTLTDDELKEKQDEAKAMVEGYLNLLVNFGVIGALIVSILFSYVVSNFDLSQDSIDFFGDTATRFFKYIFLACVNISVTLSLLLIFRSVTLYKHLSFWMPDLTAQLEWIQQVSITSTVVIAIIIILTAAVSIPFGAAAAISPIAGLISTISVLLTLCIARDVGFVEDKSELLLQRHAKRVLNKRKKQPPSPSPTTTK